MKTVLFVDYHIDKLTLIYKVPAEFRISVLTERDPLMIESNVFISETIFSNHPYVVRYYKLLYTSDPKPICIGVLNRI